MTQSPAQNSSFHSCEQIPQAEIQSKREFALFEQYLQAVEPKLLLNLHSLRDGEKRRIGVTKDCLAGKTEVYCRIMQYLKLYYRAHPEVPSRACMHYMPLSDDLDQFEDMGFAPYLKKWEKWAEEQNIEGLKLTKFDCVRALSIGVTKDAELEHTEAFDKVFTKSTGGDTEYIGIILVAPNADQIYRSIRLYRQRLTQSDQTCHPGVYQSFDESHLSTVQETLRDKFSMAEVDPSDPDSWRNASGARIKPNLFEAMRLHLEEPNAIQVFGSATLFNNMFRKEYPLEHLIALTPGPGYIGVTSMKYTHIKPTAKKGVEDPCLVKALADIRTKTPLDAAAYNLKQDHPINLLITVDTSTTIHEQIYAYCVENNQEAGLMVYNSKVKKLKLPQGVAARLRADANGPVIRELHNHRGKVVARATLSATNEFSFGNKAPLYELYQVFDDLNAGSAELPHLITIGGSCLRQGKKPNSTSYRLRLTHQFIRSDTTCDNALQMMRSQGYAVTDGRPDARTVEIYCTKEFHHNLLKTDAAHRKFVKKLQTELNVRPGVLEAVVTDSHRALSKTKLFSSFLPTKAFGKVACPIGKATSYAMDSFKSSSKELRELGLLSVVRGPYIHIDLEKFGTRTKAYQMLENVEKILLDSGKIDEWVRIDWVNKEIMKMPQYCTMTLDSIRGNLWTRVRSSKRLAKTSELQSNSLLYGKNANEIFVRLCR